MTKPIPLRNSERSLLAIRRVTGSSWFVLLNAGISCASSVPALPHERNVKTMNDTPTSEADSREEDEMLPEYDFDYRKARPNRFALRGEGGHLMVVLDPDVAEVFTTSATVNAVLRALITTMPKTAQGRSGDKNPAKEVTE